MLAIRNEGIVLPNQRFYFEVGNKDQDAKEQARIYLTSYHRRLIDSSAGIGRINSPRMVQFLSNDYLTAI